MTDSFAGAHTQTLSGLDSFVTFSRSFARALQPGDIVALSGALGAGKTTLVRAAVSALHGSDQTSSPTFTFWHRYPGTPPIDHIDLYRIDDPAEVTELGLDEAFDGSTIAFIEWWNNAPNVAQPTYHVDIAGAGDEPRRVRITQA